MNDARAMRSRYRHFRFEGPYDFLSREWRNIVDDGAITYRLRAWSGEADAPRAITRAGGTDFDGILDIGESRNGRRRLDEFVAAVEGKPRSHAAGWDYVNYGFGKVFMPKDLKIEFVLLESKELAQALERALLEEYHWRYKDRPPLNASLGHWRAVEAWLTSKGHKPRDKDDCLDLSRFRARAREKS